VQAVLLAGHVIVNVVASAFFAAVEPVSLSHNCIHSDEVTTVDLDSGREQVGVTQGRPELNPAGTSAGTPLWKLTKPYSSNGLGLEADHDTGAFAVASIRGSWRFEVVDVRSGGSVSGMIAGVEKVLSMTPPDAKIIPGHGPLSTPADVRKFVQMLKETRALVVQAADQGKSAEQMKQDRLLAKYEELGKGFIKTEAWIDLLFAEATQKGGASTGYQNHGHADEQK
jgi:hypothetical protein